MSKLITEKELTELDTNVRRVHIEIREGQLCLITTLRKAMKLLFWMVKLPNAENYKKAVKFLNAYKEESDE